MAKKYIKSTSNYVQKSNPVVAQNSKIFETDLLSYSQPYNDVNGNLVIRSEGGFTFIVNTTPTDKKTIVSSETSDIFTLEDILISESQESSTTQPITSKQLEIPKTYIDLEKTYDDLTKFSYFGSCNTLIKGGIEDIINRFPAGLYISYDTIISDELLMENGDNELMENGELAQNEDITIIQQGNTLTIPISDITNTFGIDLNSYANTRTNLGYDLRVIASSYNDFVVVSNDIQLATVTGLTSNEINQTLTFNLSNPITLSTSLHIRPNNFKINEFFDSLDDLQRVLLNRKTSPKYRSLIKIPKETEFGTTFEYRQFIWETPDTYNLDISSMDYVLFVQELVDASNYIDEVYSDNLYRMLAHDSIKNMDTTYERVTDGDLLDEYIIGGTKIQKVLRLYGREFDQVKKYIDGISFSNNITYNKENNLPEQYLSGKLNMLGWDVNSITKTFPLSGSTVAGMFPGALGSLSTKEVDSEVNRRMIINSPYIWRSKGTKKAIRKVMNLLGVDENYYQIREYTQKVDNFLVDTSLQKIADLNSDVRYVEIETTTDETRNILYTGLNLDTFVKSPSGSENYYILDTDGISGKCIDDGQVFLISGNTYGYPRPMINSNSFYFQQKGSWYRETGGYHTDYTGGTYVNEITTGNNPHVGSGVYDGGFNYVDQFKNLFKNDIDNQDYYPTIDITGHTTGFTISSGKTVNNDKIIFKGKPFKADKEYFMGYTLTADSPSSILFKIYQTTPKTTTSLIRSRKFIFHFSNDYKNSINWSFNGVAYTFKYGETWDLDYDQPTNTWTIKKREDKLTLNLKNFVIGIDTSKILNDFAISLLMEDGVNELMEDENNAMLEGSVLGATEDDIYNIIKSLLLPYLEQVIPSTAIFDFVKINTIEPKWILAEKTCERYATGTTQTFTGKSILRYKNINYFDTGSTGYAGLIDIINKDFGVDGNWQWLDNGDNNFNGFDREVRFRGDDGTCNRDASENWSLVENMFT